MRKVIVHILIAALLAAACAKNEVRPPAGPADILFEPANYLSKAGISGTVFPTSEKFSVYAWSDGTVGEYYMDNETVSYVELIDEWKPSGTYYWPDRSTVDFQCYYPAGMSGITIARDIIDYKDIDVEARQEDLMYSDKSVGFTDNMDVPNGIVPSKNTGVPIIFRHALAKVKVQVELAYNHKEEYDGTVTDWEVSVGKVQLLGLKHRGSCHLSLSDGSATGLVPWTRPVNEKGFNVWTDDGSVTSISGDLTGQKLLPEGPLTPIDEFFVLPQMLEMGAQQVKIDLDILTIRNGSPFLHENFTATANLRIDKFQAWQMNQSITYKLKIAPTQSSGAGPNPDDPVDPENPDMSGAVITFDPAVDGWDSIGFEAVINL